MDIFFQYLQIFTKKFKKNLTKFQNKKHAVKLNLTKKHNAEIQFYSATFAPSMIISTCSVATTRKRHK